jgi:hypothetical protein
MDGKPKARRVASKEPVRDDPEQSERFVTMAKRLEADESGEKFQSASQKIFAKVKPAAP